LVVIPGLTQPALACPVLDTGYLIRGNPVFKALSLHHHAVRVDQDIA
jgi:hypothetical protein